jgi:hypothetical protein
MNTFQAILRALHEGEEGHTQALMATVLGAGGAIALAVGAAEDSSVAIYIGGIVLAVGLVASMVLSHLTVDYEIYDRLNKLEK